MTTAEATGFGGLTIRHDGRVLTPRPWTTAQARWMADLLRDAPAGPVLELCSGAGQIGLLTAAITGRDVVLVDVDPVACRFAVDNAAANRIAGSVDVRTSRLESALRADERFPGILVDPPWVCTEEVQQFPEDPVTAIDGGADGLDVTWSCLRVVDRHLAELGCAVLQLGSAGQARRVLDVCNASDELALRVVEVRSHEPGGVLVRLARPVDDRLAEGTS